MKKMFLGLLAALCLTGCEEQVARVGGSAPGLAVLDASDQPVDFQRWQGHYTYLNFWSTTCGACLAELKEIKPLSEKYRASVQVVAVNVDGDEVPMDEKYQLSDTYIMLRDSLGISRERYQIFATPMAYIIGPDGRIRLKLVGMQKPEVLAQLFEQMARNKL